MHGPARPEHLVRAERVTQLAVDQTGRMFTVTDPEVDEYLLDDDFSFPVSFPSR
jgi:hypothetical protein